MDRPVTILLSEHAHDRYWARIAAVAPAARAVRLRGDGTFVGDPADVEVVFATSDVNYAGLARKFYGTVLHTPGIRWFQSPGAGFDGPFFTRFAAAGGRLTVSHVNASPIAEYVLWAVLDHTLGAAGWRAAQLRQEWVAEPRPEVRGQTWAVVGFGAIGRAVAALARPLGVHVRGVRRTPTADDPADEMYPSARTTEALAGADVVVLCTPLDASTANMADAAFFAAMEPHALFVNVGRGGLVDEAALVDALDAGRPAAAALDVAVEEPLPAGHPFWSHPRITVTPHVSGAGARNDDRLVELFAENLGRYLRGEPLRYEVDAAQVLAEAAGA